MVCLDMIRCFMILDCVEIYLGIWVKLDGGKKRMGY